jgi:CheY-like chemotaxis protein
LRRSGTARYDSKLALLSSAKRRTPNSDRAAHAREAPLVLLVDDYADAREMYAEFLEFAGMRTSTAASGEEGVAKALAEKPTIIVMDFGLPGIDGAEATRRLKGDPRTKDIPVVVMTAHEVVDCQRAALDAGAAAVLGKPVLPIELLEKLMAFVDTSTLRDSTTPPERNTGPRKKRT